MKWLLWTTVTIVSVLGLALLCVYAVGISLPAEHVAEGSIVVFADIDSVAQRVREVEQQPSWRRNVSAIAIDDRSVQGVRYRERSGGDEIAFVLYERVPSRQFESVITDPTLPFGGHWLIRLEPVAPETTAVTIREDGIVHAPVFRALSKYMFGHATTLNGYLQDLAHSFETGLGG